MRAFTTLPGGSTLLQLCWEIYKMFDNVAYSSHYSSHVLKHVSCTFKTAPKATALVCLHDWWQSWRILMAQNCPGKNTPIVKSPKAIADRILFMK